MTRTVLHIDASARFAASVSRKLSARVVESLGADRVIHRDLAAEPVPHVTEDWTRGAYIPEADRTPEQKTALAISDALVAELQAADVVVIGTPVYNFTVPAALKAWMDQVARAGVTFRYTENGPEGLLKGKRAILAVASGGTEIGSEIDFLTPYARFFLGFIGITEVEVVAADRLMADADAAQERADAGLEKLAA
jgi:FMN-dependent NADH-azoreductase